MKRFLINILIFFSPIIVCSDFIDQSFSNLLKSSNSHAFGEYTTWNDILNGNLNSDIYIYGSSRAWKHFNSKTIEDSTKLKTYNLGMDGHRFHMQHLRHILALEHNTKPKIIIHSVDIGTLGEGSLFNEEQFLPYMRENKIMQQYMQKYDGFSWYDYNLPLVRYTGKYRAFFTVSKMLIHTKNPLVRIKGYQGQDSKWNNDFDNAKKTMKKYEVPIDSATLRLFDSYLKDCRKKNIEVILVYSPYYIEGQEFIKNQSEFINLYQNLADKYNFKFIDYTKDDICNHKNYFFNASHLNKDGAEVFSKKFASDLKTILNQ